MAHLYNGKSLSTRRKGAADICNNMVETSMCYCGWKKPDSKGYKLHDCILEKQAYREREHTSGGQRLRVGDVCQGAHREILWLMDYGSGGGYMIAYICQTLWNSVLKGWIYT